MTGAAQLMSSDEKRGCASKHPSLPFGKAFLNKVMKPYSLCLTPSTASEPLISHPQPQGCRSCLQTPSAGVLGHSKMPIAHRWPTNSLCECTRPSLVKPVGGEWFFSHFTSWSLSWICVGGTCFTILPHLRFCLFHWSRLRPSFAPS